MKRLGDSGLASSPGMGAATSHYGVDYDAEEEGTMIIKCPEGLSCPESLSYVRLDELSECYAGVTPALSSRLWQMTAEAEEAGRAQPLGGDGSNGTTEEPIVGGDYDNLVGQAWERFTDEEKAALVKVAEAEEARIEAFRNK